jgi:hypothetical protein
MISAAIAGTPTFDNSRQEMTSRMSQAWSSERYPKFCCSNPVLP